MLDDHIEGHTDVRIDGNGLLAALGVEARERLATRLEDVDLALGQLLCEPHRVVSHAWFPSTAVVSLQNDIASGAAAETAVVGHEGMVGVALILGDGAAPGRAVVQHGGRAWRLPAHVLKEEFARGGEMRQLLLRYTLALIGQMSQTAVCNRHHSLDQQLCRWLLMRLDRAGSDTFELTQQTIADTLGVRRAGVSEAASSLQRSGLIGYSRGHIQVRDRAGLEARSCECYGVVKAEYERLLQFPLTPVTSLR